MRVVPERAPWRQIVTVFGCFLVGPWAGLETALRLAPDSDLLQTVTVVSLMAVFVGGAVIWCGLGIAVVVVTGVWRLVRGRGLGPEELRPSDTVVPPGYRVFPLLGCLAGVTVGLLAGALTDLSLVQGVSAWTLGFLYGLLLWTAAHHGYLPFPEPE